MNIELLRRHDRPVPHYTSYPTAQAFHPGIDGEHLLHALAQANPTPLSLYIHLPFCREACWFCGCNRITTQAGSKAVTPYLNALEVELELLAKAMPMARPIAQLHWGGGTPNYLNAEERSRLWDAINKHFPFTANHEASIEVNPEQLSQREVQQLRNLGFNRISFGLQDVDPLVQKAVNRVVPVDQLRAAMGWMRAAAFESVNLDVICGLPLQTPKRFAATINEVANLRPDRISLFSFAYLPEQLPLQRHIKAAELPSREQRLEMLEGAHSKLLSEGYVAIGMDHFALKNDPLAIAAREGSLHRNFQGYTTQANLDLLGVGLSAISLFPRLYTQNTRSLNTYIQSLSIAKLAIDRGLEINDPMVLLRRHIILGLMCNFAIDFDSIAIDAEKLFKDEWKQLSTLEAEGLLTLGSNNVSVNERGRWLVRVIAAVFDPDTQQKPSGSRLV